jgi:hypothetical protein
MSVFNYHCGNQRPSGNGVEGIDKRPLGYHKSSDAVVPLVMALRLNPNYEARAVIPGGADFPGFDGIEAERRLHRTDRPCRVGWRGRLVAARRVNEYVQWQANRDVAHAVLREHPELLPVGRLLDIE